MNQAGTASPSQVEDAKPKQRPWRLAAMMGLVFAVQGAFWPLLSIHLADLGIQGRARGWIFATLAIGSAIMPLGAGHLVDRLIATQWFLAIAYTVATGLLIIAASGVLGNALWIFLLFMVFWSLAAPAYSLCNSLAMRNLDDPARDFGWVRLWGTVGWMVAGWVVSIVMAVLGSTQSGHGAYEAIWVAAAVSAIFAVYCLTLPDTPPLAVGSKAEPPFRAFLTLARQPEVFVFLTTSFGVYLTVPLVYQVMPGYLEARGLPRAWVSTVMTIGQTSEIACLAILPWMIRRFGQKRTMALGIVAWVLRFFQLALTPPLWLAVGGTLLHGVGIACFTVGGQLFLDGRASRHLRASAQALLLVGTSGLGALLGNVLAGELTQSSNPTDALVFVIPCVIDGALLIYFLRGFRTPVSIGAWAGAANVDHPSPTQPGRGSVVRVGYLVTESGRWVTTSAC